MLSWILETLYQRYSVLVVALLVRLEVLVEEAVVLQAIMIYGMTIMVLCLQTLVEKGTLLTEMANVIGCGLTMRAPHMMMVAKNGAFMEILQKK